MEGVYNITNKLSINWLEHLDVSNITWAGVWWLVYKSGPRYFKLLLFTCEQRGEGCMWIQCEFVSDEP